MSWRRVLWAGVALSVAGVAAGLLLELPWMERFTPQSALLLVAAIVHRLLFWCVVPAGLALVAAAVVTPRVLGDGGTEPGPRATARLRPARRVALAGAVTCLVAVVAAVVLERWALVGAATTFSGFGSPGFLAYRAVASALSNVAAPGAAMVTALALAPALLARESAAARR